MPSTVSTGSFCADGVEHTAALAEYPVRRADMVPDEMRDAFHAMRTDASENRALFDDLARVIEALRCSVRRSCLGSGPAPGLGDFGPGMSGTRMF
jgi:hypothetical protein